MTELEKVEACRRVALTSWGEVNQYDWTAQFCKDQIKERPDVFLERNPEYEVDLHKLSDEDIESIGFGSWSEESNLKLIPIWLKPFLKNVEVKSISGEVCMLDESDNDHRFGYLAYGIER